MNFYTNIYNFLNFYNLLNFYTYKLTFILSIFISFIDVEIKKEEIKKSKENRNFFLEEIEYLRMFNNRTLKEIIIKIELNKEIIYFKKSNLKNLF